MIRRLSIVPYARMQFVDVTRRPAGARLRPGHRAAAHRRRGERRDRPGAASRPRRPGCATGSPRSARTPEAETRDRSRRHPPDQPRRHRPRPQEPAAVIARQRLHPLSPVLKGVRSCRAGRRRRCPGAAFSSSARPATPLVLLGLLRAGAAVYSAVAWRFTGYEVVGRELRIHEGVLSRRTRAVPLERLQADRGGAARAGPALRPGRAEAGRGRRGQGRGAAGVPARWPRPTRCAPGCWRWPAGRRPHRATRADGAAPGADADRTTPTRGAPTLPGRQQRRGGQPVPDPAGDVHPAGRPLHRRPAGLQRASSAFFAVASMVTAVAGTIGAPVMRILNFWNFRIGGPPTGACASGTACWRPAARWCRCTASSR